MDWIWNYIDPIKAGVFVSAIIIAMVLGPSDKE